MAACQLLVEGNVIGTRVGIWCEDCALPSAYEADAVITLVADPTRVIGRFTIHGCMDCGRQVRNPA